MLKILSWNILYGFHDMKDALPQEHRIPPAQELIQNEDPDILVINEAAFGHHWRGRSINYKDIFNFPYSKYQPSNDEWGNMIFSKYPITDFRSKLLVNKTSLGCSIQIDEKNLMVETFHTYPFWLEEIKTELFRQLIEVRPTNYILVGDFNLVSHRDKNPFGHVSLAIPMLENSGLTDAFGNNRDTTFPTKMIEITGKNPDVRLDHCFISNSIEIHSAQVIKNNLADQASDHYPISILFSIK